MKEHTWLALWQGFDGIVNHTLGIEGPQPSAFAVLWSTESLKIIKKKVVKAAMATPAMEKSPPFDEWQQQNLHPSRTSL